MPEDKIKLDAGTVLPENLIITEEFRKLNNLIENTSSNMFITGKAGCGKSTLLEYFRQNTVKNYVILAYTGITALKARGKTIHSFFKFPPRLIDNKDIKILRDQKMN
jgi:predicted ATPase